MIAQWDSQRRYVPLMGDIYIEMSELKTTAPLLLHWPENHLCERRNEELAVSESKDQATVDQPKE